jgi:hypothetical protein
MGEGSVQIVALWVLTLYSVTVHTNNLEELAVFIVDTEMKSSFGPPWTWRLQAPRKRRWLYACLLSAWHHCQKMWVVMNVGVHRAAHWASACVLLIVGLCFYLHCHKQICKTPIQERVSLGVELLLLSFLLTWFCFWHHFVTYSVFRHFEVCFQMTDSQFCSQNFECNLIVYFLLCPTYTIWCSVHIHST